MIPAQSPMGSADRFAAENYWRQLHPWCVIRLMPNVQRIVVQRFRKRSQAEEYLKVLRRLVSRAMHQHSYRGSLEDIILFDFFPISDIYRNSYTIGYLEK